MVVTSNHRETRTALSRDDYSTPWPIVRYLAQHAGGFLVDVAASPDTHKANEWYGPGAVDQDGLDPELLWGDRVFCNPPYNNLKAWCEKAVQTAKMGSTVTLLIPARTDTEAFHLMQGSMVQLHLFKGRISFELDGVAQKGTMFASMAVVLGRTKSSPNMLATYFPVVKDIMTPGTKCLVSWN
jgi:phage N-6-adenine-methyltransferase